jgi:hypothetical protein
MTLYRDTFQSITGSKTPSVTTIEVETGSKDSKEESAVTFKLHDQGAGGSVSLPWGPLWLPLCHL